MVDEQFVARAEAGDIEALIALDAMGLLLGQDESAAAYAERLRCLRLNIDRLDAELRDTGHFAVEDVRVEAKQRIPAVLFGEADAVTQSLYGFRVDWVPGFFINPRFSLLFGGCAYYFYPDFFALFIIRRAFAERQNWLIYSRRELLAHELCHVARIALGSQVFEELFAYQTAASPFRRIAGSVFRGPKDAFLLLGSTFLLLAAQIMRTVLLPALPILPFWLLVGAAGAVLACRLARLHRIFGKAVAHAAWFAPEYPRAVLFRCTDDEVLELAGLAGPAAARNWLEERKRQSLRWQVIARRFCAAPAGDATPLAET